MGMGGDQENCMRITRAAKKRAAAAAVVMESSDQSFQPPPTKKRVVLGELTNVVASGNFGIGGSQKNKTRLKKKEKKTIEVDVSLDDPQMCAPYAYDIYDYLHSMEMERKRRPMPDYIEKIQKDITTKMRGILVDWLVEVADEYKLVADTIYLTVSYIDRFLSLNTLNRQRLQLLGVSCMLIASKYEEISPPHVDDFCYITDNTYTKEEVVKMETEVLRVLNFEMGSPTIKTFLRRFTKAAQENPRYPNLQMEFLGCYLAELSLLDYSCIRFLPSLVAASVIFLTKFTLNPNTKPWNTTLQHCSGYKPSDLKDPVFAVQDIQLSKKWGSLAAVRDKYNQHKFKCVSTLTSSSEIPLEYFED